MTPWEREMLAITIQQQDAARRVPWSAITPESRQRWREKASDMIEEGGTVRAENLMKAYDR